MSHKIALITGATSGIGRATAEVFAGESVDLIVCGRRTDRLQELKRTLEDQFHIDVCLLVFDIRKQKEVNTAISSLEGKWRKIDYLVNNAGLAKGFTDIQEGSLEDWENMIDTNVKGLLYISRQVMPLMIENRDGHIVNIGSIAGKEVYAKGNVYCATKHAVEAITKSMRLDLLPHQIKVSAVCPGAVETEFSEVRFDGDQEKAKKVYHGYQSLKAIDVAESIWFIVSRPAHVTINDLLIMPTAQANASTFHRE